MKQVTHLSLPFIFFPLIAFDDLQYKVALLTIQAEFPVELAFIPGSYSEHSALAQLDFNLPKGSMVWQDSSFTDYEFEDFYF